MNDLTSNQYYRGLRRRFDKRARRLIQLGYKYERIEDLNMAVFVKRCQHCPRRTRSMSAAYVSAADNRAFFDQLNR